MHNKLTDQIASELLSSPEIKEFLESAKAGAPSELGTFEVVITTENLDRYDEVIKLEGWQLAHYLNNPVVLWAHDHHQPIGMATSVEIADGKMIAKGVFGPTEKAQEIRKLYDFGIIRATSVGFMEREREGNLITKAELLEFSFVSVPANPFALRLAMEKDLSVNELVTKGILFVDQKDTGTPPAPTPTTDASSVPEEKAFSRDQISKLVETLKATTIALEAVVADEPEREEEPAEEEETDEEKAAKAFAANRRILQEAATIVGDVLAESRRAIEAQNA